MTWFVMDVEADGPAPGLFSMVSFGAVRVDRDLMTVYIGKVRPISLNHDPETLAVSGTTREEHHTFPSPYETIPDFARWLAQHTAQGQEPKFVSDNPGYDAMWLHYYFALCGIPNPFGHSARRIGDLWAGMHEDTKMGSDWKRLRKTKPTHNPVDDARGNAEALIAMADMGLRGIPNL